MNIDSFAYRRQQQQMDGGAGREEIKLRMWVFKITSKQFDVCVEGYRPKDVAECELKCWHSTGIIDRINSRNLLSSSGSVYYLQGPIDAECALAYGYPHSLIEQFRDGFPPDWRKILLGFYRNIVQTEQYDVSQWFNSSTTVEQRRTSFDLSSRRSLMSNTTIDSVSRLNEPKSIDQRRSSRISGRRQSTVPMTPVAEEYDYRDSSDNSNHRIIDEISNNTTNRLPLSLIRNNSVRKVVIDENDENEHLTNTNDRELIRHDEFDRFDLEEMVEDRGGDDISFKVPLAPLSNIQKTMTITSSSLVDVTQNVSCRSTDSGVDSPKIIPNIILRDWVFKLVYATFGVCVEGYRIDAPNKCWHSTSIAVRLNSRMLKTSTGTVYGLDGPIDMETASGTYGYSDNLIEQFKDGFPPNWHQILKDFHRRLIDSGQCNVSQWFNNTIVDNRSMNMSTTSMYTSITTSNDAVDQWNRNNCRTEIIQQNQRTINGCVTTKKNIHRRSNIMPMTPLIEERNQSNDNNSSRMSTDSSLSRTRSGRIVKPPLAGWALQRITYDIYGNPRHLSDSTTKTANDDNNQSRMTLSALSDIYNLSPTHCAIQQERRMSLVKQTKSQQSSKKSRKIVNYSSSSDSSDESPMVIRRKKPNRLRFDDSFDEELIELERRQRNERRHLKKEIKKKRQLADRKRQSRVQQRSPKKKSKKNYRNEVKNVEPKVIHRKQRKVKSPSPVIIRKAPKNKRWINEEYKRLQIALRAIAPRNDADWEKVAKSIGGGRNRDDCRIAANRMFAYNMQIEDESIRSQQHQQQTISAIPQITARVGTAAYQVQAHRLLNRFARTTDVDENDMFDETNGISSMIHMPSLADLNPNDSLLSVMITPTNVPRGKNRAFVPRPVSMTPGNQQQHSTPQSPIDSAHRDRTARYVHRLMQDKQTNMSKATNEMTNIRQQKQKPTIESSHQVFERRLIAEREEQSNDDDVFSSNSDEYFSSSDD